MINQPIAVYLPKCAETIFANLGIVYSGNIYANLDVKSPPLRIKGVLDIVNPVLIVTHRALEQQLRALGNAPELFRVLIHPEPSTDNRR